MAYLWNIMDRKTRFLIASRLSEKRDSIGAMAAFNRAIRVAHGSEPERVLTERPAYNEGIRRTSRTDQHIARVGIGKPTPKQPSREVERDAPREGEGSEEDGRA